MKWLLVLLLIPSAFGLELSEVMFDALGDDNGLEYIELIGTDSLAGCTVTDSKSSDSLVLVKNGSNVIMIVEEDSPYLELNATVYSAGKAIGNGLGNSYDEIVLRCDDVLVNVSYNISEFAFDSGQSIYWEDGWIARNSTPGYTETEEPDEPPEIPPEEPETPSGSGGSTYCNATLVVTISDPVVNVGDEVSFSIVSNGYASFVVLANGTEILAGDTLRVREYGFAVPDVEEVVIKSYANNCDAKQRFTRKIVVLPAKKVVVETPKKNITNERGNVTMNTIVETEKKASGQSKEVSIPFKEPLVTGQVVYDDDLNVIPWISSFGIVTLGLSSWLLIHMKKTGDI